MLWILLNFCDTFSINKCIVVLLLKKCLVFADIVIHVRLLLSAALRGVIGVYWVAGCVSINLFVQPYFEELPFLVIPFFGKNHKEKYLHASLG